MSNALQDSSRLTIHQFSYESSSLPRNTLFEQGRKLLLRGISGDETWHRSPMLYPLTLSMRGFQFIYAPAPPRIAGSRSVKPKEWGAPTDHGEIYRIRDLTEFISTELPLTRKRDNTLTAQPYQAAPPATKRKLNNSPLTELIPQPHFLSSPFRTSSRKVKISSYKKSTPVMIPPYTHPLKEFHEWSRCAWIILIRGKLPWPECTSSVLLEFDDDLPSPSTAHSNELVWTSGSVTKFWEFLVDLRTAGNLGPLTLSYHSALSLHQEKLSRLSKTSPADVETSRSVGSASSPHKSLAKADYIKIYHDWTRTLQLRTILDSWSFASGEDKVRLLVGARLLLLDEKSQGVMVL